MTETNLRVLVALSGGVDSAVCAALLQAEGLLVHGATLRLWKASDPENCLPLSQLTADEEAAQAIARHLNIPFSVIDAREDFRSCVIGNFLRTLKEGGTPSPCPLCNPNIKWKSLLDFAYKQGIQTIATGHYAQTRREADGSTLLLKARDAGKDQSYMLCQLTQEQLRHSLFPLGSISKTEVRQLALQMNLPVASRPDSQDLCFLGALSYQQFLEQNLLPSANRPGPIYNSAGLQIGEHSGLPGYTIGQRKGLPASTAALYVIGKDLARNALIVGHAEDLGSKSFVVRRLNWIPGPPPSKSFDCTVKIRYRAEAITAHLQVLASNRALVELEKPLRDVSPGQMAVFYEGERVLGGGTIEMPE